MNREFLLNISFLLFINLLIKPFYIFGIDRTVQNTVGEAEYGLYFALFNFSYLFQIINDFGIQQFNNRSIAQHNHLLKKFFPNILILKTGLALLFLATLFLAAWYFEYEGYDFRLLLLIGFNQILLSSVLYLRSNISGIGKYRVDSLLSALDKLLLIAFCSALLWGNIFEAPFQIEWFILAQTASWGITALAAFLVVKNHLKKITFKVNKLFIISLLKQSYPFALVVFLMTIYTRIDAVMIERMLPNGKVEAGIYAASYRLLDASNMAGLLFATLLLPMFSKLLKKKERVIPLLRMSFELIMGGMITFSLAAWVFREEIMFLLYDAATPYYGEVMNYLILTLIATSGMYIYSTLLTANGSLKKMNILFTISIILNVILNYYLIHEMKAAGAALATLVTQSFIFLGKMYLVKKEMNIKIDIIQCLRILVFGAIIIFIGNSLYQYPSFDWVVKFFATIFIGLLLAFLFRLIDLKAMAAMIKEK